ncbi:hypothetical protein EZV62_014775 [Acer yangbiense]|uniref:Vesicle transport protein n=1 Tax=Acer yangbiense TaxID=1000413 RepID=A0A5C7HVI5_9ROSI|nr:hypothetical protein EZV62_014775 [Acer yangbiense]
MEKMNHAFEKMKMLVGMEAEDEESAAVAESNNSLSFMDDFNRQCALTTKQVLFLVINADPSSRASVGNYKLMPGSGSRPLRNEFILCQADEEASRERISTVLTYTQRRLVLLRFYGFVICLVSGLACTLLSMLVFLHPIKFGITFTFGNLLSLGSTAFLIGPKRQVTMMLDPVRIYATAIYLASMIIALFCAFYVHNKLLTLLAIILEFGALIWYSLSYIPFARSMVSKVVVACFDTEF